MKPQCVRSGAFINLLISQSTLRPIPNVYLLIDIMFVLFLVFFVSAISSISVGNVSYESLRPVDSSCDQSIIPNCGKTLPQLLISNGFKSGVGSAPWNVAVYRKNDNAYELICGGTLISTNLVISAAHCFTTQLNPTTLSATLFKVAVGKIERDILIKDNNYTQILDVKIIYVEQDYQGFESSYAYDIAILVLKTQVTISKIVSPACLDWAQTYFIPNGLQGKVVGWGKKEDNTFSDVLLEAHLPYINRHDCRNLYSSTFKTYVSKEKFCAGSLTGSSVLAGDSGAGLTFLLNGSYVLTGVVSIKNGESIDSVALFTDVRHYTQWICNILTNHTYKAGESKNPMTNNNDLTTTNEFENDEMQSCAKNNGFTCEDKSKCINRIFVCDQDLDCDDGSDEDAKMCKSRTCKEDEFSCKSSIGQCIPKNWVCDGYKSCHDGSDEDNQMCKSRSCEDDEFNCKNNQCIPIADNVCTGIKDCYDGSDEDTLMCKNSTVSNYTQIVFLFESLAVKNKAKYCRENQFMCKDGIDVCIPRHRVCNGKDECFDGSDEDPSMCNTRHCKDNEFKCKDNSGRCISRYKVCNGKRECADGSDENAQMCKTRRCNDNEFYCENKSGRCIPRYWVCDGTSECSDNSDEDTTMCKSRRCKNNEFRCKHNSGQCISRELVCDGMKECADGSDEDSTMCKKRTCERDEFSCIQKKGQCIPKHLVCNTLSACADGSDEDSELCKMRSCAKNEFKCEGNIGQCIHRKYICDGSRTCADGSDEDPELCRE